MATVSVVIPTFNRALFVKRAVQSVLTQTYQDFEIIVVDDGSIDDTHTVLNSLSGEDSRVHCIYLPTNCGAQVARNVGCRAASGEYIAFLDSDNEWLPDKLRLQMELFRDSQVGVVYCGFRVVYPDGHFFDMLPYYRGDVYKVALANWLTDTSTLVVRKDILEKIGYWDEKIRAYQEWDMCIRLARTTFFDFVDQVLVIYHRHSLPRISNDRFLNALGHMDVVKSHKQEIMKMCGAKKMCEHYFRIAMQFVRDAHRYDWGLWALSHCLTSVSFYFLMFLLSEARKQTHLKRSMKHM
ncbi:MAG: glycosyltransferase family 2 protein [Anaerolineales bacterium]